MRILFVTWRDLAHSQAGGSEVLVDRLARGLLDRGHEAAVVCGGPVDQRAYPVVDAGGTYSQYLRAPIVYWRRFRRWDLVVDVENGVPFFSPLWRRGPVMCLVHHVHGDQWEQRFPPVVARVGWFLERRVMPWVYRSSVFLAVSPSTASALREIGVAGSQIHLLPNAVEVREPGLEDAAPLFLAVARLVPHKRIDLLLGIWDRVRPLVGGTLVIVGSGPEEFRLRAMAGEGVDFRGHVDEEEKAELLDRCWMLVHTAQHEGWGLVAMEAAGASRPTLAFDVAGVRDAIISGRTGVLVHSDDEMVEEWVRLAGDPHTRRQLGAEARNRAASFSVQALVGRFLDIASGTG